MHNLKVKGCMCEFDLKSESGFANSIRRVLLMDVERWAPYKVTLRKNTSSQTDEHIAHRIGLIPFTPTGAEPSEMSLSVTGREAMASDLQGTGFKPVYDVPIALLGQSQTMDLVVSFARGRGRDHVRYSLIGPVSYSLDDGVAHMAFETITNESPITYLLDALLELEAKIDKVTYFVERDYDHLRKRC